MTTQPKSARRSAPAGSGKIDFKKEFDSYRAKRGQFRVLDVPPLQYLMIDGHGDPNTSPQYAEALGTLYPVAYKLKFASKHQLDRDYVVMPLEGLWTAEDMDAFTTARDKSQWRWTMMIMTPDWITDELLHAAIADVAAKEATVRVRELRLERLREGTCVQTLHVGGFDDEGPVLAEMHEEIIPAQGMRMTGRHHEIYLSDPRKTAPEKLRTILRQPVERIP